MNEQSIHQIETIPEGSFEFGNYSPPSFQSQVKIPEVASAALAYEYVRQFMSGTPLRRPKKSKARRCTVYLIPEDEGGFSVVAADLLGVASQGDNEKEALSNIGEAYSGVIQSYKAHGQEIPWLDSPEKPEPGSITRTVLVHV